MVVCPPLLPRVLRLSVRDRLLLRRGHRRAYPDDRRRKRLSEVPHDRRQRLSARRAQDRRRRPHEARHRPQRAARVRRDDRRAGKDPAVTRHSATSPAIRMAGDVFCAPEAQTKSGIYSPASCGTMVKAARLAQSAGVRRSCRHRGNDPRPDCDQRGHVCRDKACGRTRCADSHARLHPAIVLAPDAAFPAVPALPAMSST